MPGLAIEGHVLRYTAVSLDQQMGRYSQVRDLGKERVHGRIQTVTEQIIDVTTTEFSWRQADIVYDQQTDFVGWFPATLIWRGQLTDWMQKMVRYDKLFRQMWFQPRWSSHWK